MQTTILILLLYRVIVVVNVRGGDINAKKRSNLIKRDGAKKKFIGKEIEPNVDPEGSTSSRWTLNAVSSR